MTDAPRAFETPARARRHHAATSLAFLLSIWLTQLVHADGYHDLPLALSEGCLGIDSVGVALHGDGTGRVTVNAPGPILGVFLHWVGPEDTTPAGDGTSTLRVNGTPVVGRLSDGAAGWSKPPDWYSWWANIGPANGPYSGLGLVHDLQPVVDILGWDGTTVDTNGATVIVIYDTGACAVDTEIRLKLGIDWYYYGTPDQALSELLVYEFDPAPADRRIEIHVSHAGTDSAQASCRGGAIWMVAGTGSAPLATDYDLVGIAGNGRGYGINGGVEIVNDPFTSARMPCMLRVNPAPDQPYEAGHPCRTGASKCAYRAASARPKQGGDVGPEWAVTKIDAIVPADSTFIAIQLESERDQFGESGSWAGVSFLLESAPRCGNGILDPGEECDDGNNQDGDGCSADCKRSCDNETPPELECLDRFACADPGICEVDLACDANSIVSCAAGPYTVDCAPSGPYPVGRTDIDVTVSGSIELSDTCSVVVRDCEPPECDAPEPLLLECGSGRGVPVTDPRIVDFLDGATGWDNCAGVAVDHLAPDLFPATCAPGATTPVVFRVTDASGHETTCSSEVVVVDTTAPEIVCPDELTLECTQPGGIDLGDPLVRAWFEMARATDECGVAKVEHPPPPPSLPSGCAPGREAVFEFTAVDDCGLTASCNSLIRVVDTTDPTITCPAPIVLDCPPGGSVAVTDPRVRAWLGGSSASDTCGAANVSHDAPAEFPSGCGPGHTTVVNFRAEDECGNPASCTSTVTVRDASLPTITCPAALEIDCAAAGGFDANDPRIKSWLASATASDHCGIVDLKSSLPGLLAAGCAPGAVTPVTWLATDSCGNVSSCGSEIRVVDAAPPIINCPEPMLIECTEPGGVSASDPRVQSWLSQARAGDLCGRATLTNNRPDFLEASCAPGGTTEVTFTAVDDCGNMATCVSAITVLDTPAEVHDCPPLELCISPPNHDYVCFSEISLLASVSEPCGDTSAEVVVLCESSQCDDAPCPENPGEDGDGTTTDDCVYDELTDEICLRSERAGSDPRGRYYTISFAARDSCGTSDAVAALRFWIPHDHSKVAHCIDADQKGNNKARSIAARDLIERQRRRTRTVR